MIAKLNKGIHWQRSLLVAGVVTLITVLPVHATLTDVALTSVPAASALLGVAQQAGDLTGLSVDTDGNTMVVGVPQVAGKNLATAGVNISLPLPLAPVVASGKVYVYERINGAWTQMATLVASNGADKDGFGVSVAVDGNTIVVGADAKTNKNGAVYVFEKPVGGWSNAAVTNEVAQLVPTTPLGVSLFGHSVALQGGTVVVGQWGQPGQAATAATSAAYIFERPIAGGWVSLAVHNEVAILQPLVVPKQLSPAVVPLPPLVNTPPPYFGVSVAIDGNMIAVNGDLADKNNSAAYVFEKPVGGWATLALNADPAAALIFSPAALAIDNGASAAQRMGFDIAISGNTIVASAIHFDNGAALDSGAVFVYEKPAAGWPAPVLPALFPSVVEVKMLTAPVPVMGESFGRSVAITPERILVGSFNNALADPSVGFVLTGALAASAVGSAYIFDKPTGVAASWSTYSSLTNPAEVWQSPAGVLDDMFGYSVSAAKTTYVAGAWGLDTDIAPADLILDLDVGSAAVKETTVDLVITNNLPAGTDLTALVGGERLTYTITVANNDPIDTASNVVVEDAIPAGLSYLSATATQGGCIDANLGAIPPLLPLIQCSLGSLAPNTQASIDLIVDVLNPANIAHTASVTATESVVNSATTNNAANVAPTAVADAGAGAGLLQTVGENTAVVLSSAGSGDTAPGTIVSYAWSLISAGSVILTGANTATAGFSAPAITSSPMTLSFQLTVTDDGGASASATVDVNVTDANAPQISLNGTAPLTVNLGSTFTDPGAVVSDNVDADVTINGTGSVDSNVLGSYTLTYSASDAAGNGPTIVTRTVNVVDGDAPTIVLNGNNPMTVNQGVPFSDPGAVVSDNVDADVTINGTGSVDSNAVGQYSLTYSASDAAGNGPTTVTRTVNVVDGSKPVITLNDLGPIQLKQGEAFVDPGAVVSDNVDANRNISGTGTVDINTVGSYTVSYNAEDNAKNIAVTKTLTVNVVDGIVPTITLNGDNPLTIPQGGTFSDPGAVVSDNIDADSSISGAGNVDPATVGSYTVTYSALDAGGNAAADVSRTVVVNALPMINGVPTATVVAGVAYSYTLNATDAEGDSLSYSLSNAPTWLSLDATGVLSGTPAEGDVGLHENITIMVGDGTGSVSVGPFTVEVTAVAAVATDSGGGGGGGSLPLSLLAALLGLGLRRRSTQ